MKTSEFYYDLPKEYIAQYPPGRRGNARLLVLRRTSGEIEHRRYRDIPDFIEAGDLVVLNKTKVIKARIFPTVVRTGKTIEILLLDRIQDSTFGDEFSEHWYCLVGGAKKVRVGEVLDLEDSKLKLVDRVPDSPRFVVAGDNLRQVLAKHGHVPLPAYIKRSDSPQDKVRYNTYFAEIEGSVAAPTASLNLTPGIIEKIRKRGAKICYVNLEVGWGTFAPVNTESVEDFKIHQECIEVPDQTAEAVNSCTGRIWAFGTTVVRTLETAADARYRIRPFKGETSLFIYPGYEFKIVDVMVTNFHMPGTSLVMLVSAFAGKRKILEAYDEAKRERYRFLSYGDSMLIL